MRNDFIYDIETYPNVFTLSVEHAYAPFRWYFEISDWRNDSRQIVEFLHLIKTMGGRMVGFNNVSFDYPVLHQLVRMGHSDAATLYQKVQAIFASQDDEDSNRWVHRVKPSDYFLPQIDLFLIHHFDNRAKSTSLKALEFSMRADTIEDLPFPVGISLTQDQVEVLKRYNAYDVSQTKNFLRHSRDMISFREELTHKYGRDFLNANDTAIGKTYFQMKLEEAGVSCYDYGPKGRQPRQTKRPVIHLKDCILPWIQFQSPELTRVLDWFKGQSITETKGVFKDLTAKVNGFEFVFGLGGIHGSVENTVVEASDDLVIESWDVTSYYPNLAITNGFYPAHLGPTFVTIYKHLYEMRKQYPKKSAESAMLKLALNGTYGDSNNPFSVFYDPQFTMSITLQGQLLLCLLAENLMRVPSVRMVMSNTDGLEYTVHPDHVDAARAVCEWWQGVTGLTLENARYKMLAIRDVNSYVGVYEDGKVKRKGAYEYDLGWHQDASALVVPKVAEQVLVHGAPIRQTIENWPDLMDFMCRIKVPRSSHLYWGDEKIQNTSRYYIAKGGKPLSKLMPPLKGKTEWRKIGVESGWGVQVCNDIKDATLPIDFDWYVAEVEKLTLGLK